MDFVSQQPSQHPDFNSALRSQPDVSYERISGPKGDFAVPAMEELGISAATTPHRGGETIALGILDKLIADTKYTATFEKPMTSPAAFEPQSTSKSRI